MVLLTKNETLINAVRAKIIINNGTEETPPLKNTAEERVPSEVEIASLSQIYAVDALDNLVFHQPENTFDEFLTVTVTLKKIALPPPPAPPPPPPPIPPEVLAVPEILDGKISEKAGNPMLKYELLQQTGKVKNLLEEAKVLESLVMLNTVADELQFVFNCSSSERIPIKLVVGDLKTVQKQLKMLL